MVTGDGTNLLLYIPNINTEHDNILVQSPVVLVREHPFNLKGAIVFLGYKFSVGKFDWNKMYVSEMGRKNILFALCALKNIVFVEKKKMSRQKQIFLLCEKNYFYSEKNQSSPSPPPFKLNGCSLSVILKKTQDNTYM